MTITLTDKAVSKIKEISESEGIGHLNLRIKVVGGGCYGLQYDISFLDLSSEYDEVVKQDDVSLFIDPLSLQYLDGTEVDFLEGLISSGFKFSNPNSVGNCACGNSFGV